VAYATSHANVGILKIHLNRNKFGTSMENSDLCIGTLQTHIAEAILQKLTMTISEALLTYHFTRYLNLH